MNNLLDYGAVPDDPAKTAINTAVLNAALAAGLPIYVGNTFYIGSVSLPAGATITGKGLLIASGVVTGALLSAIDVSNVSVEGVGLQVDAATYPATSAVLFQRSSDCRIERCKISAPMGITASAANRLCICNNHIFNYAVAGIYITPSGADPRGTDLYVTGNVVEGGAAASQQGINIGGYDCVTVTNNHVRSARVFSISVQFCTRSIINGNISDSSCVEAVAVTGDSFIVAQNIGYFGANHTDFGMSFYGTTYPISNFMITGNLLNAPFKTGIAIGSNVQRGAVLGNYTYNAGQGNQPNARDGIGLYGDATHAPSYTFVGYNVAIDWVGHMQSPIAERAGPFSPGSNGIVANVSGVGLPTIIGIGSAGWNNEHLY